MAISIDDIKKLRAMTGAGLADVKKALTEAEGDFDKAKELLRERGLAIAAKRSDRETSNGCVLVKKVAGFAATIALKCETDFVANGADFIALTQSVLDAAIAAKAKTIDEVKEAKPRRAARKNRKEATPAAEAPVAEEAPAEEEAPAAE